MSADMAGKSRCYRCGRNLTRKERDSFVPGYPYRICNACARSAS